MSYSPAPPGVKEHSVLVLGTGGTIASEPTAKGYAPISEPWARDIFFKRIRQHPQLSDAPASVFANPVEPKRDSHNNGAHDLRYPKLRTPPLNEKDDVVVYEILDLENHMDSSEMTPKGESRILGAQRPRPCPTTHPPAGRASLRATPAPTGIPVSVSVTEQAPTDRHEGAIALTVRHTDWNKIAELIYENWGEYDGFVVLSGTDTLAYTSSILSFLFADAGKPIVVTGAQIPLREPRSDGWYNLLESLLVAGTLPYAGVGVVFYHLFLQGCR